jgi:hypothetical protein
MFQKTNISFLLLLLLFLFKFNIRIICQNCETVKQKTKSYFFIYSKYYY